MVLHEFDRTKLQQDYPKEKLNTLHLTLYKF